MTDLEVLAVGRISADLYPQQQGPMRDVRTLVKSVGGTATNVAVASARLGHRVALATKVGDDAFGDDVRHALTDRFGVDTTWVGTHPDLATPLAFAELNPVEEPNIIFYRAPRAPDMDLLPEDVADAPVEEVAILWIPASRFADDPSRSTVQHLLNRRRHGAPARAGRQTHTIFDLDWRPHFWASEAAGTEQIAPMLEHFSMVIGNRDECRVAVGSDDPETAADRLLDIGVEAAVIKMGGDGVLVALPDGTREQVAPFPVEVVCGLGAGDAFGGALCHGLLSGWSVAESVRYGNAAGAIVAGRLLCADDMPYVEEIDAFLAERGSSTSTT